MTFVDLYISLNGVLRRLSLFQDLADFGGLGDLKQLASEVNMEAYVSEIERRFTQLQLDRRQVNVRPRRRLVEGGGAGQKGRKLLSFGTMALSEVLEAISPELKEITQFDLGSRLAYLTGR